MKKNIENLVFASSKKSTSSGFGIDENNLSPSDQKKILLAVIYPPEEKVNIFTNLFTGKSNKTKRYEYENIVSASAQVEYESISDEYLENYSNAIGTEIMANLIAYQDKILNDKEIQEGLEKKLNDFLIPDPKNPEKSDKYKNKKYLQESIEELINPNKQKLIEESKKIIEKLKPQKILQKNQEKITVPISDKSDEIEKEVRETSGIISKITRRITDYFSFRTTTTHKIDEKQLAEELKAENMSTENVSIDNASKLNAEEVDANKSNDEVKKEKPCPKCLEFNLRGGDFCEQCGKKFNNMDFSNLSKIDQIISYGNAMKKTEKKSVYTYRYLKNTFITLFDEYRVELDEKFNNLESEDSEKMVRELEDIFKIRYSLLKNDYFEKNPDANEINFVTDSEILSNEKYYNYRNFEYIKSHINKFSSVLKNFLCEENGIDKTQANAQIFLFHNFCSEKVLEFFIKNKDNSKLQTRFPMMDLIELTIKEKAYGIIKNELKIDGLFDQMMAKMGVNEEQMEELDETINIYFKNLFQNGAGEKIILDQLLENLQNKFREISSKKNEQTDNDIESNNELKEDIVSPTIKEIADIYEEDKQFFGVFTKEESKEITKFQYPKHIETKVRQLKMGELDEKYNIEQQKMIFLDGSENTEKQQFVREQIIEKLDKVNKNCLKKQILGSLEYKMRDELHHKFIDNINTVFQSILEDNFREEKEWIIKKDKEVIKPFFDQLSVGDQVISQEIINRLSEDALDYLFIKSRDVLQYNKENIDEFQFNDEFVAWLKKRKEKLVLLEKENRVNIGFGDFVKSLPINKREELQKFYQENILIKRLTVEEKQKWLDKFIEYSKNNYVSQQNEISENDLPKS